VFNISRVVFDRRAAGARQAPCEKETAMNAHPSFFKRYALVIFFTLAFLLTWGTFPLVALGVMKEPFPLPGPILGALIVAPLAGGWLGLKKLVGSLFRWRVAWYWYAVAVGVPLAVAFGAVGVNMTLGGPGPDLTQLIPWYGPFLMFGLRLINPGDGPMMEELGWRGFTQPRIQGGRSRLPGTLLNALLIAAWHAPIVLLFREGTMLYMVTGTVAVTVYYAWLYNRSGGSVLITLIGHAVEGTHVPALGFVDMPQLRYIYMVIWCAVALGVVLLDRAAWRNPATEPEPVEPVLAQAKAG
jgi:membrane protease YdiL (CAAX protease family)